MAIDETTLRQAVASLHEQKRKFKESYDLLVSLKDLNLKDPKDQVEFFASIPHALGKRRTVCALVGPEMIDEATRTVDLALEQSKFERMQKKELRKVAARYDFFLGQANIMPKIAASFGRVLGPRGKMPNPKAGCIVPPKSPLQPLVDRLQKTVKVSVKKSPCIQILIGTQAMNQEQVVENVLAIYDQIIHHLPKEENNVRHVYLKVTMSKPIRL